jgi:hypothetical protein
MIMPVIEAQCASILVPHDHRHINHERSMSGLRQWDSALMYERAHQQTASSGDHACSQAG